MLGSARPRARSPAAARRRQRLEPVRHCASATAARDALRQHLRRRGIATAVYYPTPLHLQPALAQLGWRAGDFPHAERAAAEVLALPIYPELSLADADRVVAAVAGFFR